MREAGENWLPFGCLSVGIALIGVPVIAALVFGPSNPYAAAGLAIAGFVAVSTGCAVGVFETARRFVSSPLAILAGVAAGVPVVLLLFLSGGINPGLPETLFLFAVGVAYWLARGPIGRGCLVPRPDDGQQSGVTAFPCSRRTQRLVLLGHRGRLKDGSRSPRNGAMVL